MIQKILTVNDEKERDVLRLPCTPVDVSNAEALSALVTDLVDTMQAAGARAAGLAANQIDRTVCAFVMRWGAELLVLVNPVITKVSDKEIPYWEGCLSRPGMLPMHTRRHKRVTVQYYDVKSAKTVTQDFKGRDAVVIQHEMDHLNGILI